MRMVNGRILLVVAVLALAVLAGRGVSTYAWTAPVFLNTNAPTDSGDDRRPRVATDGGGNWVAVWQSSEPNMGGGIGTDADILFSLSTDSGATWTPAAALNTNAATGSGGEISLK